MKFTITILTLLFLFISCKKDRLKDDKEILIGKWNWIYSIHDFGWCENMQFSEILTPSSEGSTFEIEFLEKGKARFYKENKMIGEYRIVFKLFEPGGYGVLQDAYKFGIDFDNDDDLSFNGAVNSDTLWVNPFKQFIFEYEPGCEEYDNYFLRE